jgi:hypothetical protein
MPLSQSQQLVSEPVTLPVLVLTLLPTAVVLGTAFCLWYLNKWH